jgi:putative membrane protein
LLRITLAALHLLALGIGVGSLFARGRALHAVGRAPGALARAFTADTWWGLAGLLWIGTGLWRWLAGTEKATGYYSSNHVFYAKMGLLGVLLLLEIRSVVTLVRWRRSRVSESDPAIGAAARGLARFSDVQLLLVLAMLVAAVLMARGYGARG